MIFPKRERENGLFKEKPSTKAVFPFSRGKNRISQGVENRGSLINMPLALRDVTKILAPQGKWGSFSLKAPFSGDPGAGKWEFLTPKPSFPDLGDFDSCRGWTRSQIFTGKISGVHFEALPRCRNFIRPPSLFFHLPLGALKIISAVPKGRNVTKF